MFGGGGQPSSEDILEATKITATAFMEHYNKTVESCYSKCILKYTGEVSPALSSSSTPAFFFLCLYLYLSIYLYISLSVYLSVCLSIYLSVYLLTHLPTIALKRDKSFTFLGA